MCITVEIYKKHFQGYQILDCVIRKKNIFYFVVKEMYDTNKSAPSEFSLAKRVVSYFLSKEEGKQWSRTTLNQFDHFLAGVSYLPTEQFVGMDLSGNVFAIGGGTSDIEDQIVAWGKGGPQRGGIAKLRTIDDYVYAAGSGHTVLRRDGKNDWHGFTKDIPYESNGELSFEDIDGFSANDIYCVGGKGEVFHFDGKLWKQLAFPSNTYLMTVCCAGDGYVYIGAQEGNVFKGRGDEWKRIHKDHMTIPFKDMVWYQGKVWCTSDYGLWEIENDKLKTSSAPPEVRACAGNLSVGDGVMLIAGLYGAAYHDGNDWQMLIDTQKIGQEL